MSVPQEPRLTTTIFSWLSRIDFRGAISRPPGLACEHLVSRLHVEHAPVLRRDEVDFLAIELAHMHAPPFVEQLEIHGVLEQAASIDVPLPLVR